MPDQKILPLPIDPVQLSWEEWELKFKPIKNPIDTNAAYDGLMFETYGDELDYVQAVRNDEPGKVWTITSSGDYTTLGDGYHYVDREGYFITEVVCPGNESYEIVLGEPSDFEDLDAAGAMSEIQQLLSGREWEVEDLEEIAEICRRAGYEIKDIPEDA
jgi:hypothetical protein